MSIQQHTAVVVDDEVNNRENLLALLSRYCPGIEVIGQAASVAEATALCNQLKPEVIFLDIEMPGGNGFSLLEKIKHLDYKVIFVTAFDAYALDAIKCSALDYLMKPIDTEELINAVNKLQPAQPSAKAQLDNLGSFLSGEQKRIALSLADEIRLVDLEKIVRIEADNNYCRFMLATEETVIVSKHLGHFYDLLKAHGFVRVHQSHLINRDFLDKYVKRDGGYLVLSNGHQVPVSRTQREHVARLFSNIG